MSVNPDETFEDGPINRGTWDTRTKENSSYCEYCKKWLSHATMKQLFKADVSECMKIHQESFCKNAPRPITGESNVSTN